MDVVGTTNLECNKVTSRVCGTFLVEVVVFDRFYIALFSTLEQTHCALHE